MSRRLEEALDECLDSLQRGVGIEACLLRFPKERDELEPLLRTAQLLRRASVRSAAPADALSRAKGRFLNTALQEANDRSERRGLFGWWPQLSPSRGFGTVLATLVLLVGVLGGGGMVSANSIPGDALYGVKRASEQVTLFLTFGNDSRADLQRSYERRRVQEVEKILEIKREIQVEFSGVVEAVQGNTIIVDGIPVYLPVDSTLASVPSVGTEVEIVARTQGDGTVAAQVLSVEADPEPTATVSSQLPPSPTPTLPKPTATPQSSPTETLEPTQEPTVAPEPTQEEDPTEAATATTAPTETPIPPPTAMPTPTWTITPTQAPPPRDIKVRFEGRIEELAGDYWRVDGRRVSLELGTRVLQDIADAQVGGWALVQCLLGQDGKLTAQEIVVLRAANSPPEAMEFSGMVEAIGPDRWVIAGKTVLVEDATEIDGEPRTGAQAWVKADLYVDDGRLVAKRIEVKGTEKAIQFVGVIESFSDSLWVVSGQEIVIDAETEIEGEPLVGAIAEVEAIEFPDGTTHGTTIRVPSLPAARVRGG